MDTLKIGGDQVQLDQQNWRQTKFKNHEIHFRFKLCRDSRPTVVITKRKLDQAIKPVLSSRRRRQRRRCCRHCRVVVASVVVVVVIVAFVIFVAAVVIVVVIAAAVVIIIVGSMDK